MKIFIDSANLKDIDEALRRGFASGITTNPSLLAKEPKATFDEHVRKIIALLGEHGADIPLSIEVFSKDPDEMLKQARSFVKKFKYKNLSVKIQIGWDELAVIKALADDGISVNCTACMTIPQGMMAARAGARYVSYFWGRIRDGRRDKYFTREVTGLLESKNLEEDDFDPAYIVRETRAFFDAYNMHTEIIAGSMRSVSDIKNSARAGAHIVTIPPKFFRDMASHFKTDEVVNQFMSDFNAWLS